MCGILGGNNSDYNYRGALDVVRHRGPDGKRIIEDLNFTLCFTRLAIRDLSDAGMQPMNNGKDDVYIVFNGEIYGYDELKTQLKKKYEFKSSCDAEVILYAYLEYGDNFVTYIDGMFAIAIYDRRVGKIKLFRDRVGIKPLYYYYDGNSFAFFSEIKQLEKLGIDSLTVDNTALYDFLTYQYIPTPKTLYCKCYKLSPAHKLVFDLATKKIEQNVEYWNVKPSKERNLKRDYEELVFELRRLIKRSISNQLISDVPIGVFLSGGIDSSIVTYESNLVNPQIKAFTMGFEEKEYDEVRYANELVERYDINCLTSVYDREQFKQARQELRNWFDEPFADTSAYPSFAVSQFAKKYATVVLSGDGGDELFGGYLRYLHMWKECKNKRHEFNTLFKLCGFLRKYELISEKFFCENVIPSINMYEKYVSLIDDEKSVKYREMLGIPKDYDRLWYFRKFYDKDIPIINRLRYLDFKTYLHEDCLTKMDRVSMANSLEVRVPFLSKEIIEFAFSLSEEECVGSFELKKILKDMYKGVIPDEILYHPKKGFSIPKTYMRNITNEKTITEIVLKNNWNYL